MPDGPISMRKRPSKVSKRPTAERFGGCYAAGMRRVGLLAVFGLFFVLFIPPAEGGARRFTYVYEATTAAPGPIEMENWITWGTSPREERRFNAVDFRHELEFGVTEHLQLGLYLADWGYREDPGAHKHGFRYHSSALEAIYNLTNPTTDLLGSALYQEIRGGPEEFELESKIILQKNIDRFVFGYNATIEAEWEGNRLEEKAGEFSQTFGVSYEISPRWLIGAEFLHEIDLPDWSDASDSIVYGGPNLSYREKDWWATITPLVQLTEVGDEVDFQTRLIFGFGF